MGFASHGYRVLRGAEQIRVSVTADEQRSRQAGWGGLHSDEVLPLVRVRHFRVGIDELGYFVRINVVRGAFIVARYIVHALVASRLHSEHAGSLAMEELAALVLTPASIAKVGAFEYVALVAVGAFRAVA